MPGTGTPGTPCSVVALKAILVGQSGDVALTLGGSGTSFATAKSGLALTGGVGSAQGSSSAYVYTLGYDRVGNVISSQDAFNGSWNYGYDTLNRLVSAANTSYEAPGFTVPGVGNPANQCWNYDPFGNRTFELDSASGCPNPLTQSTATHYASYNRSNKIAGSDTQIAGPIYDAAGNIIQDAIDNYLYDAKGRLCAVENLASTSATEYVYDAGGSRVAKGNWTGIGWPAAGHTWTGAVPNCSTPVAANGFTLTAVYLRGAAGAQDVEIDPAAAGSPGGWHQNVYAAGGLMATYTDQTGSAPALYFNFNDWLGTKRLEVNAAGQAVNYWGSDPFGDYLTPHVAAPDPSELHLTGKERDTESGNDYFGARYYASNMGRFLSPDWSAKLEPVPYAKLGDPQSLNLYAYVGNNPSGNMDADGHQQRASKGSDDLDLLLMDGSPDDDPLAGTMAGAAQLAFERGANPTEAMMALAQQQSASGSTTVSSDEQARRDKQKSMVIERTTELLGDKAKDLDISGSLGGCHLVGGNCEFKINNPDLTDAVNSAMGNTDPKTSGGRHAGAQYHDKNLTDSLHHDNDSLHVDHFNSAKAFPLGVSMHFIIDVTIGHLPYYGSNHAFSY